MHDTGEAEEQHLQHKHWSHEAAEDVHEKLYNTPQYSTEAGQHRLQHTNITFVMNLFTRCYLQPPACYLGAANYTIWF